MIKNIKVLNLPTFINDEKEFFDLVYDDTAFRLKNLIILKWKLKIYVSKLLVLN